MWIVLESGEVVKEGDEAAHYVGAMQNIEWRKVSPQWVASKPVIPEGIADVRREMKGVALLDHLVKTDEEFRLVLGAYIKAQISAERQ